MYIQVAMPILIYFLVLMFFPQIFHSVILIFSSVQAPLFFMVVFGNFYLKMLEKNFYHAKLINQNNPLSSYANFDIFFGSGVFTSDF